MFCLAWGALVCDRAQRSATSLARYRCGAWGTFPGAWEQHTSENKGSTWRRQWEEGLLMPELLAWLTAGAGKGSTVQQPAVQACVSLMGAGSLGSGACGGGCGVSRSSLSTSLSSS